MEWTEDFESGLPDIDAQHRQIFLLIQRVSEMGEQNRSDLHRLILELEHFTRSHFEYEERLMAALAYPDAQKHATEHAKLLVELRKYQDNTVFNPRQLCRVLSNWLMSHTLMEDRPLAHHVLQLRPNGEAPADRVVITP